MQATQIQARLSRGVFLLSRALTPGQCAELIRLPVTMHHDDEGGHAAHAKTLLLPHVARALSAAIEGIELDGYEVAAVDEMMKAYRLEAPEGAVPAHRDEDFPGPDGTWALFSVIVYLNEGYAGGETAFEDGLTVGTHGTGDALLFPHDLRHEALAVRSGVKHVLKTDLFVRVRAA